MKLDRVTTSVVLRAERGESILLAMDVKDGPIIFNYVEATWEQEGPNDIAFLKSVKMVCSIPKRHAVEYQGMERTSTGRMKWKDGFPAEIKLEVMARMPKDYQ